MIKNIFFDLDDTILDFNKAERNALSKTLLQLDIEPTDKTLKRYSEINKMLWKLLEKGEIERETLKAERYRILFNEIGVKRDEVLCAKIYEDLLSHGHFFIDGAKEVLEELHKSYSLYLVSNGSANVQKGRIESAGIAKYFKEIYISQLMGANKPSRDFFDKCFAEIPNLKLDEAVIVGDSLTSDIKGGKNAEILTIWFNQNHETNTTDIIPDYEINSLSQLSPLIKKINENF